MQEAGEQSTLLTQETETSERIQGVIKQLVDVPEFTSLENVFAREVSTETPLTDFHQDIKNLTQHYATPETFRILKEIRVTFVQAILHAVFRGYLKLDNLDKALEMAQTDPTSQEGRFLTILRAVLSKGRVTSELLEQLDTSFKDEHGVITQETADFLSFVEKLLSLPSLSQKMYASEQDKKLTTEGIVQPIDISHINTLEYGRFSYIPILNLNPATFRSTRALSMLAIQLESFNPETSLVSPLRGNVHHVGSYDYYFDYPVDPNIADVQLLKSYESPMFSTWFPKNLKSPPRHEGIDRFTVSLETGFKFQLDQLQNQALVFELERFNTFFERNLTKFENVLSKRKKLDTLAEHLLRNHPLNVFPMLQKMWEHSLLRGGKTPNTLKFLLLYLAKLADNREPEDRRYSTDKEKIIRRRFYNFKQINPPLSDEEREQQLARSRSAEICTGKDGVVVTIGDVERDIRFNGSLLYDYLVSSSDFNSYDVTLKRSMIAFKTNTAAGVKEFVDALATFTSLYKKHCGKEVPVLKLS